MSMRNLDSLLHPQSVVVIGASERAYAVGTQVLKNMLGGGFTGQILAVNPKYPRVATLPCYRNVTEIPTGADLAVICTPAETVPRLIEQLGAVGTKAAIVLSAGMSSRSSAGRQTLREAMLVAARPHLLRILGPNCLGILAPGIGLNASFAQSMALPGRLALISQSGAVATALLDWSNSRGIGYSYFITLGESADVDVGDLLDYMAQSADADAILLHLEAIAAGRKFLSAARRAARNKLVVVVKAGRAAQGALAVFTHSGALAGSDVIYDAALRRAGMLRVRTMEELFATVQTLARAKPLRGERLAIVTNGGGIGVMATDALIEAGGALAELDSATLSELDTILPPTWSHGNPVDIVGDATAARYAKVASAILASASTDAVVFLHAPTAIVPSEDVALALVPAIRASSKTAFTAWPGGASVESARHRCEGARVPFYETPEQAVQAFTHTVWHRRNQAMLMQTPELDPVLPATRTATTETYIRQRLHEGPGLLPGLAAMDVLRAYGIPCLDTKLVRDADEAVEMATELGYPLALKVYSKEIFHKSDVGGVVLNLEDAAQLRLAVASIHQRITCLPGSPRIEGFLLQKMVRRVGAVELLIGASVDPVFGPVVLAGHGGAVVEVLADRSAGIVPLNDVLARDMLQRTRVHQLLLGYRNTPAADEDAICRVIIALSQLMCEVPQIASVDINPLLADADGVVAMDARIQVQAYSGLPNDRLAILPYPSHLQETLVWRGSPLTIRPARAQDEALYQEFFAAMAADDVRHRFFGMIRQLRHRDLASMAQLDYDREIALLAVRNDTDASMQLLGEARAAADPDNEVAEFAIMVRSELKGCGLGSLLLDRLIHFCRSKGTRYLSGTVMRDNISMLALARRCGFTVAGTAERGEIFISLAL
ncbi:MULTISPECIES: bifunctional acetate--CoA ligase family protein/GNAT family N-acetyltransferase [unclassified Achromobacter]|uniref:bifunctional acetate--CoA ligase family protein/GNAT family N-acetyltransferase n=1 Tax=unclassified Achromobacter TaxID=2626865 RepID=UPI000B51BC9D|nr:MULTISPECIES: bifunctional acetate--CoA ligase family protein/GNAT family N-acetyltransferase [unclassified Achromobacter]OWT74679.1 GNAT family N-acetyltransferase [Achromobacter sp. HZ34]OWT79146.1 GNAT family N-acetyltransferase [Achromobacter sp. HZ28]